MYRIAKGGAITIDSFLNEQDRNIAREHMLRTASSQMREAAKIGLQSLYADPKDVLEKYKDFDIVKEMKARQGAKLLWVRARAIDADICNANGDYFSKEELLKERDIQGKKLPAYKTFEGVPIYTNHKNDDIEQAKGMVVYAEWDDKENCVYCTFFVDEEAYPDIARNIRTGIIHDVSMGCSVDYGTCSKCGNKAYDVKDYCECLKKHKGKTHPTTGKKVYEENYNLKFIELSCVGDGAFEACEIQEIYDVDDVLNQAENLEKKAEQIKSSIVLAHQGAPVNPELRSEYDNFLRSAMSTTNTALKLAQSPGNLVGGQLLAGPGASQNSTVAAILNALGIDPRSGLNILDMINLALNFLEVAVMNMFARKDNIDLTHVQKVTKAMSDLQATMQDMIDDGVDVGSGQRPQPLNQGQTQQAVQQAPQAAAPVGLANYSPMGNVGRVMDLSLPQETSPVGGGVALASSDLHFVWASNDGSREVFASNGYKKPEKTNKVLSFSQSLLELKNSIGYSRDVQSSIESVIRVANERNKNIKNNTPKNNGAEGRNEMDHFAKIASEQRKKLAAAVTIDFKVEDAAGNKVVLSTDGSITGFTNGKRNSWEPILTESQLNMMENGQGTKVAAELLNQYSGFVRTALLDVKERLESRQEQLEEVRTGETYDNLQDGVKSKNTGVMNKVREELLESKQTGKGAEDVKEILLGEAGLYAHRVKDSEVMKTLTELVAEVAKGVPTEVIEKRLSESRTEGSASAHEIMSATINALGRSVVSAMETPDKIIKVAQMLAEEPMLPEMIGTSAAGSEMRADEADNADFFSKDVEPDNSVAAILKQLGDAVTSTITAKDLADAIAVVAEDSAITKEGIMNIIGSLMMDVSVPSEGLDVEAPSSKTEELKSALQSAVDKDEKLPSKEAIKSVISAGAMASEETGTTPSEVIDSMQSMPEKQMIAAITRAKTASSTDARLRSRERRDFWGVRTASADNIDNNVIGWLADYSTNFDIPTKSIVVAAKRLVEDYDLAEKLLTKAIQIKRSSERTAGIQVTQDKSECLRFVCTKDDLEGVNPSDDAFEETFKQKAISVLQEHGFTVDPNTFSFTDLIVTANGDVTATVSTRSTKSFDVSNGSDSMMSEHDAGHESVGEITEEPVVVMTASAKASREAKRNQILLKYAQVPGMTPAAPPAGPVDPNLGQPAPAESAVPGGDLGISAMTGGDEMNASDPNDQISEPGAIKPWGSVCPVCGSDDVNISESNADCQACGTTYKVLQSIELVSMGSNGKGAEELPDLGMGEDMGLGAATAPTEVPPAPPMGAPGAMAPMASYKAMYRLAATVDSDVYLRTAMPDFDKTTEKRLPIGMICPKCGNREAHKVKNNTFCYDCGNYSKTVVSQNKKNPSKLDVNITWID
jgi:hypothetical protein